MTKIEKIRDDLYVRKGWDGYRVVYPNRIDLSKPFQKGNIHWQNVIGQWHFWVKGILFLLVLYFFVQMYKSDVKQCREFVQNIDSVCIQYKTTLMNISQINTEQNEIWKNISNLNLSIFKDENT